MAVSLKRSETKGHYLVQCVSPNQDGVRKHWKVPLPAQCFKLHENVLRVLSNFIHSNNGHKK